MTAKRAKELDHQWQCGYETAYDEVKLLIEAARVYRDAYCATDSFQSGAGYEPKAWGTLYKSELEARDKLFTLIEAARTFEVSHEEQG